MADDERTRVDLRRLPAWAQYAIALAVAAAIVAVALSVSGDDRDPPEWLTETVPPVLGALALLFVAALLAARALRRRR